jgi:hypothetical protein
VCLCATQIPGQFVGVRLPGQGQGLSDNQQLYSIACSPYESRRDSAYIGGSIIEVCAGGEVNRLACLRCVGSCMRALYTCTLKLGCYSSVMHWRTAFWHPCACAAVQTWHEDGGAHAVCRLWLTRLWGVSRLCWQTSHQDQQWR